MHDFHNVSFIVMPKKRGTSHSVTVFFCFNLSTLFTETYLFIVALTLKIPKFYENIWARSLAHSSFSLNKALFQ